MTENKTFWQNSKIFNPTSLQTNSTNFFHSPLILWQNNFNKLGKHFSFELVMKYTLSANCFDKCLI